ncbi:hypothetical protein VOLCADRAFT_100386 [Volvox carteri f. nagariensis]|uniref:Uncharacterized protein n=1 Tax=Volvox carteri f. nagariensis TaxID=3068 RepID=D8UK36_VOLCA|nr:uncharacterized protein VOLCADRAFT_100386 [Volvox carteri f. nagariensis]EFJ39916.1 hypothetical protein VOLCADRAFT_100386 [Volvox carteri f. nagariensis]|eukprot:XP_002959024.1 hypothetical protein VOLCADRAFT_100386 [Volvox carteri f. nagariensis]
MNAAGSASAPASALLPRSDLLIRYRAGKTGSGGGGAAPWAVQGMRRQARMAHTREGMRRRSAAAMLLASCSSSCSGVPLLLRSPVLRVLTGSSSCSGIPLLLRSPVLRVLTGSSLCSDVLLLLRSPVVQVLTGSSSCSRVPLLFCSPAPRIQMSIPHPGCICAECTQALTTACPSLLG